MNRFNIRVYGILLNENNTEVLITDEFRLGMEITKFPGGGLEFGEGTIDCIKRECMEEFGQEFEILDHFYTTDFFQESAFNKNDQLISIYYLIKPKDIYNFPVAEVPFSFKEKADGAQIFRWVGLDKISGTDFTFPVDKKVAEMLAVNFKNRIKGREKLS
jgi:8-oxo-dGTP diphosphatase